MDTVLQVQDVAPVDLLIGTDVLVRLGFGLVRQEGGGYATNLLHAATQKAEVPLATVKLLHATRLPARHSKLVRVEVPESQRTGETRLFEPEMGALDEKELAMADAVVGIGAGGEATLVIANHGAAPVQLPVGEILGRLHPAKIVDGQQHVTGLPHIQTTAVVEEAKEESPQHIAAVQTDTAKEERRCQLLGMLKLKDPDLTEVERRQVTGLVNEHLDLFALSSTELGRTTVVEHNIDTTDHPPVKQAPRQIPFAL